MSRTIHAAIILIFSALGSLSSTAKPSDVLTEQPEITNSIGMKLVFVPAGRFTMGSPLDEQGRDTDEEQHEVEITRSFYLGKYEVTKGQLRSFVGDTDYRTEPERDGAGGSGYSYRSKRAALRRRTGLVSSWPSPPDFEFTPLGRRRSPRRVLAIFTVVNFAKRAVSNN